MFGDLELDEDTHEVSRGGAADRADGDRVSPVALPDAQPAARADALQLLDHVWNYDFGGDARVLETYISYLRKKVDAEQPPLIHTVRGVGYALRLPRASAMWSLRARLLLGLVLLTAVGLLAAGYVTYRKSARS